MSHPEITNVDEAVRAFGEGRSSAAADARVVRVSGSEARGWLDDLVTARVGALAPGAQTRSLLLSPTGRIRADVWVVARDRSFLLIQMRDQPRSIADLLAPYVLSSDVGLDELPDVDVGLASGDPDARVVLGRAPADPPTHLPADLPAEVFEAWRIRRGIARFPLDVDEDSTPAEGGLERLIDATKGCFLGQEAVAKIRNLGHPARIALALRGPGGTAPGDEVSAGGRAVGVVTSVAADGEGSVLMARVGWHEREADLTVPTGTLSRR